MKWFILLSCIVSSSFAFLPFPFDSLQKLFSQDTYEKLLQPKKQDSCNICIYSADPSKFKPNCFLCLNVVYSSALVTCVNGTELPKNISFSQADCLLQNCEINYPNSKSKSSKEKRSVDDPQSQRSLQVLSPQDFDSQFITPRSVEINGIIYNILKNVQTIAMDFFSEEKEPEYYAE